MGFAGLQVIFLILLAVGVAAGLWGLAQNIGRRARESECGNCTYPVQGIASFHCPECGVDLRLAGIVAPGMLRRRRFRHIENIGAITVAVTLLWFFLSGAIGSLPHIRDARYERSAGIPAGNGVLSQTTIVARGVENDPPREIEVILETPNSTGVLTIDTLAGTFHFEGPSEAQGDLPITGEKLLELTGTSPASPSGATTAESDFNALAAYISSPDVGLAPPAGSSLAVRAVGTFHTSNPNPYVVLGFGVVAVIVWYMLCRRQITAWLTFKKNLEHSRPAGRRDATAYVDDPASADALTSAIASGSAEPASR